MNDEGRRKKAAAVIVAESLRRLGQSDKFGGTCIFTVERRNQW